MNAILEKLKSKTVWVGLLAIIGSNIQPITDWVAANMGNKAVTILGVLVIVARTIKPTLFESQKQ